MSDGVCVRMYAGVDGYLGLFPFRKQKRVRTAFAPSQLLELERAFHSNHYVVGQERKELALSLNLSETQVLITCCILLR